MKISWFSAGVSSFVATWLERESIDKIIYIHIDEQHPDSLRFVADSERLIGKPIEIMQSQYQSVANVIKAKRFIKSAYGAACTSVLKKNVRKQWESDNPGNHEYIWGFDANEQARADRLVEAMPLFNHKFPLIEQGLDKEQAHGLARRLGLKRPEAYDLGFLNNNCIPCIKAGMYSMNLARKHAPERFTELAKLEREIGHSCLKDCFLDELDPARGRAHDEINEDCGIMCQIAIGGKV
jgi:hypothetical protein